MSLSDERTSDSQSSNERPFGAPPYHGHPQLPPYQSRTHLPANESASNSHKGKQRSPSPSHNSSSGAEHEMRNEPRVTMSSQGPRIAVTDPLSDLRNELKSELEPPPTLKFDGPTGEPIRPGLSRRNSDASSVSDGGGAGDYFDEFDWSEDEQEQKEARAEEKQVQAVALRKRKLSPFKILKWLGTTFLGNFCISAALIIPVVLLQYLYRNKGPAQDRAHRAFVTDNVQAWFIWAAFNLHMEWWIHLLVELFPRAFSGIITLTWGTMSQNVRSFVEVFNAIKRYIKLVLYAALSWASWAILFNSIYHLYTRTNPETESRAKYLYRIYQVVEFFFFFTLTVSAEKILIKIISMRFHRTAYAERIANITKALKTFDYLKDHRPRLGDRSPNLFFRGMPRSGGHTPLTFHTPVRDRSPHTEVDEKHPEAKGDETPKPGFFRKLHAQKRPDATSESPVRYPPSGPHTPGAASVKSNRSRRTIEAAKRRAANASSLARRAMVDPTNLLTDETVGVGLDINSPAEARRLARTLFRAYRGRHHRAYLVPSDFDVAYANVEDAKAAFEVFDSDRNGDISMTEMKNTIVETYKDRRFVAKSLEDTSSALGQLDFIFLMVAFIIIAFEAFAIFNIDIGKTITTFYTLAIGASFIFKESAQEIFDSIIFLFVTHPFDTGDRVCVDNSVMVVQKMSLLSSQFLLWDNTQIFISNALLSQMFIMNYRRSGYQWESVKMQIAFDTPLSALDAVQADLIHWLQTEPERMFEPSTAIVPQTIDFMRSITVTIGMTHRATYQDWGARWYRRNCFFAAVCYYMRKHGVQYMNSTQPILYWDPPSYESVSGSKEETEQVHSPGEPQDDALSAGPSVRRARRSTVATDISSTTDGSEQADREDRFDPDVVINDDFFRPREGDDISAGASGLATGVKPRTFMGFAPPPDEVEGLVLRKRKAKRLALANQGGEGGGG